MRRSFLLISGLAFLHLSSFAQCDRWQQRITCDMSVDLDVKSHRFTGEQVLVYQNNSPDTLRQLFFHLYFNAFKPGSEMDVRSRTIADPDQRVGARIAALKPEEQGDLRCMDMLQDGKPVQLEPLGTDPAGAPRQAHIAAQEQSHQLQVHWTGTRTDPPQRPQQR